MSGSWLPCHRILIHYKMETQERCVPYQLAEVAQRLAAAFRNRVEEVQLTFGDVWDNVRLVHIGRIEAIA